MFFSIVHLWVLNYHNQQHQKITSEFTLKSVKYRLSDPFIFRFGKTGTILPKRNIAKYQHRTLSSRFEVP